MVKKSRITSIYVFITSLVLAGGLFFLALDLFKGYRSSRKSVAELQRAFQTGIINLYDKAGNLDFLAVENIYRQTEAIDYIIVYRQKNVILSGGNEPSIYVDANGVRQYKHYWWQKVVRTYLPDPEHDQNFSVDMLIDIIPLSVLKRVLSWGLSLVGALFAATFIYSIFDTKRQRKKQSLFIPATNKQQEALNLVLESTEKTLEKAKQRLDVPLENILEPESLDEFFAELEDLDRQKHKRQTKHGSTLSDVEDKESEISTPVESKETSAPAVESSTEEIAESQLPAVDESVSEPDFNQELENLDLSNLDDFDSGNFSGLPSLAKSGSAAESAQISQESVPEFESPEISEDTQDITDQNFDLTALEALPEIQRQEESQPESVEDIPGLEESTAEELSRINLAGLSDLEMPVSALQEEENEINDSLDLEKVDISLDTDIEEDSEIEKGPVSIEELEELTNLDDILSPSTPVGTESDFEELVGSIEPEEELPSEDILQPIEVEESVSVDKEEGTAEDLPNLADLHPLSEISEQPVEIEEDISSDEELPDLDDLLTAESATADQEITEESIEEEMPILEEDVLAQEEDFLPVEQHEVETEDELTDLPDLDDLLATDTVARQDDTEDIDDLPDLDNLLRSEELEEQGMPVQPVSTEAIELSPETLQELTSTPDAGLKNLSFDEFDDSLEDTSLSVLDETDIKPATGIYSPTFESDSRFPEPPLLKGMSVRHRPVPPRPRQGGKFYKEFDTAENSLFKFSHKELDEAVHNTKWIEPLSKILLDAEELNEDFSLLVFTIAEADDTGIDNAQKFFSEEQGLAMHQFSEHSYGVWLMNTNLEGSYGIAGEFAYFMEEHEYFVAIGLSSKSERLVRSEHLVKEAFHALTRSVLGRGGIVGFRPDPRKYARISVS